MPSFTVVLFFTELLEENRRSASLPSHCCNGFLKWNNPPSSLSPSLSLSFFFIVLVFISHSLSTILLHKLCIFFFFLILFISSCIFVFLALTAQIFHTCLFCLTQNIKTISCISFWVGLVVRKKMRDGKRKSTTQKK